MQLKTKAIIMNFLKNIFKKKNKELDELKQINLNLELLINSNKENTEKSVKAILEKPKNEVVMLTTPKNVPEILKELLLLTDYLIMNKDDISKRKYLKLRKRLNYV